MESDLVKVDRHGAVSVITLNRPEARNALNRALEQSLYDALESLDADAEAFVGVLAANGPVFCAGADLKEISATGAPRGAAPTRESVVSRKRVKPLIAAVEGRALGGGFEVALACDLIVASTTAAFGLPEVKWSLLPSGGGVFRLGHSVPRRVALELAMSGAEISAERAYALGLINQLTEAGAARAAAIALGVKIAANGPLAVQAVRRLMAETAFATEAEAWAISRAAVASNFQTADATEGPRAFAEKRKPQWRGE